MAKEGSDESRNQTSRRTQGAQLPMELSFITVDKPGQRVPYWQLSQITAHAMRKSHERRRGQESKTARSQKPQPVKVTRSYQDHLGEDSSAQPSLSNNKHEKSPKEGPMKQKLAVPPSTDNLPTHVVARTHPPPPSLTPTSEVRALSEDIMSHATSKEPCDCDDCQIPALAQPAPSNDMIFGGLRTDPFQRYPISSEDYFPAAVDYIREVIVPGPEFFELLMTHDVSFEAVLTFALFTYLARTPELKKAALFHYGGTLSKVREHLLSPGSTRRAVMTAISNLAGICVSKVSSELGHRMLTSEKGLPWGRDIFYNASSCTAISR